MMPNTRQLAHCAIYTTGIIIDLDNKLKTASPNGHVHDASPEFYFEKKICHP